MNSSSYKRMKRIRRHARVRSTISGTPERPRLSVFRSNKAIYAQLIDDTTGTTLASASDVEISKGTGVERAREVGADIAKKAHAHNITTVVFDRGGNLFSGRIKALAEAAREGGLTF